MNRILRALSATIVLFGMAVTLAPITGCAKPAAPAEDKMEGKMEEKKAEPAAPAAEEKKM